MRGEKTPTEDIINALSSDPQTAGEIAGALAISAQTVRTRLLNLVKGNYPGIKARQVAGHWIFWSGSDE